MKERVIEEYVMAGATHRRQQLVKVYGTDSSKNVRDELYDLVTDRVNFHKDKVIDARIHEELSQLIFTKKGRIDHQETTHDDLVIAWALALFVIYRGGDIANQFGITRHSIKTDAELDEEVFDFNKDAELIFEKIDVTDKPEDLSQVDQQMEILNNAPGKYSYEEWRKMEMEKEAQALQKIIRTKEGKQAYARKYNIDVDSINNDVMFRMPDDVFTSGYYDEDENIDSVGAGNLYNRFSKFVGVR